MMSPREKSKRRREITGGSVLALPDFDEQDTTENQPIRCFTDESTNQIQPIGSPEQGRRRLMISGLPGQELGR